MKTVKIIKASNPSGKPTVDVDPVYVSLSQGEEVEWDAGGEEFVVVFKGDSPFKKRYFNDQQKRSGKAQKPKGEYKYKVLIAGQESDPSVIIKD